MALFNMMTKEMSEGARQYARREDVDTKSKEGVKEGYSA